MDLFKSSTQSPNNKRKHLIAENSESKRSRSDEARHGELESHPESTNLEDCIRFLNRRMNELLIEEQIVNSYSVWSFVEVANLRKKIAFVRKLENPSAETNLEKDVEGLLITMVSQWQGKLDILTELLNRTKALKEAIYKLYHLMQSLCEHTSERGQRILLAREEGDEIWTSKAQLTLSLLKTEDVIYEGLKEQADATCRCLTEFTDVETINCRKLVKSSMARQTGQITPEAVKAVFKVAVIPKQSSLFYLNATGEWEATNSQLIRNCNLAVDEVQAVHFQIRESAATSKDFLRDWTIRRNLELTDHLSRIETAKQQAEVARELYSISARCKELAEDELNGRRLFSAVISKMQLTCPSFGQFKKFMKWMQHVWPKGNAFPNRQFTID